MKRLGLILCCLSLLMLSHAQSLDQMTVATGSMSDSRLSVTIGEPCIFVATHENGTLSGGAQGGVTIGSNTGLAHRDSLPTARLWVYPNPVKERLFLQTAGVKDTEADVQVFDPSGKRVLVRHLVANDQVYSLPVNALPSGNYVLNVRLSSGAAALNVPFVKVQ